MKRWSVPAGVLGFGLRRSLWFAVGAVALVSGGIGVVLPLLPTTPFIILAAFAFGKSAPSLQRRIQASRTFGPMIAEWQAQGAIAPRFKAVAIVMMIGAMVLSVAMSFSAPVIIVQAVCMAAAACFILSRPNGCTDDQADRSPDWPAPEGSDRFTTASITEPRTCKGQPRNRRRYS